MEGLRDNDVQERDMRDGLCTVLVPWQIQCCSFAILAEGRRRKRDNWSEDCSLLAKSSQKKTSLLVSHNAS